MLSSELINSAKPKFPSFIINSDYFYKAQKLYKIFPDIGMENHSVKTEIPIDTNSISPTKTAHLAMLNFTRKFKEEHIASKLRPVDLYKVSRALYCFEQLSHRIVNNIGIRVAGGNFSLTEPVFSPDNKVLISANKNVFKMIENMLEENSIYCKVPLMEPAAALKQMSNLTLHFSSSGLQGAWDIATMSMRGINSCMRWENRQALSLVGSIADPFCGIMYITNGSKTPNGSKMLFRSLVRIVIDLMTMMPVIMVDRIYSCFYKNRPGESTDLDKQVKSIMTAHLRDKYPEMTIIDSVFAGADRYAMPQFEDMKWLSHTEYSYRDTTMNYEQTKRDDRWIEDIKKTFSKADQSVKKAPVKPKKTKSSGLKLKPIYLDF